MNYVILILSTIVVVTFSLDNDETVPEILLELLPQDFGPIEYDLSATQYDVDLYFLSRSDPDGQIIDLLDPPHIAIKSTDFEPYKQTVFLIHGWQNETFSQFNREVSAALLEAEDLNVFVVDWSTISNVSYVYAHMNAQLVGSVLGTFINGLVSGTNLTGRNVGLVGHSLGAHIAGISGSIASVQWIVGLDPSGPLYSLNDTDNRLDSSDAQFVQVIHTCSGLLGFNSSLGDADYWPNGGVEQPGCESDKLGMCSHVRAFQYYAESLVSGMFNSTRCNDYEEYTLGACQDGEESWMGQFVIDMGATGNYYLETNAEAPFAKG